MIAFSTSEKWKPTFHRCFQPLNMQGLCYVKNGHSNVIVLQQSIKQAYYDWIFSKQTSYRPPCFLCFRELPIKNSKPSNLYKISILLFKSIHQTIGKTRSKFSTVCCADNINLATIACKVLVKLLGTVDTKLIKNYTFLVDII